MSSFSIFVVLSGVLSGVADLGVGLGHVAVIVSESVGCLHAGQTNQAFLQIFTFRLNSENKNI